MGTFDRYLSFAAMPESPEERARRELVARNERIARLRDAEIPLEAGMASRIARADVSTEEREGSLELTAMLAAAIGLVHCAQQSEHHARLVLFQGGLGRGKTTACAYVLAHLVGLYVRMQEAYDIRGSKLLTDRGEWRSILRARVLVVDEVGFEPDDEMSRTTFQELVDLRQERITILCTNLERKGRAGLERRYDERTLDRVDAGDVVVSGGKSFRKRRTWRQLLELPDDALPTREEIERRFAEKRSLYVAKGFSHVERDARIEDERGGIELFVELGDLRTRALAELREAA